MVMTLTMLGLCWNQWLPGLSLSLSLPPLPPPPPPPPPPQKYIYIHISWDFQWYQAIIPGMTITFTMLGLCWNYITRTGTYPGPGAQSVFWKNIFLKSELLLGQAKISLKNMSSPALHYSAYSNWSLATYPYFSSSKATLAETTNEIMPFSKHHLRKHWIFWV